MGSSKSTMRRNTVRGIHARPCFTEIEDSTAIEPPQFGDELFVLGTGINGLIPWMYLDDVNGWIRYDRTRNANA